jgi:RNA recognition motif-containing protein
MSAADSVSPKLFIGNLSWKVRSDDLRAAFEKFGTVTDAAVVNDRETGRSRGFGFVTFESNDSAAAAQREMDNFDLSGRTIRVNFAEQRERQPRTFNREYTNERSEGGSRY